LIRFRVSSIFFVDVERSVCARHVRTHASRCRDRSKRRAPTAHPVPDESCAVFGRTPHYEFVASLASRDTIGRPTRSALPRRLSEPLSEFAEDSVSEAVSLRMRILRALEAVQVAEDKPSASGSLSALFDEFQRVQLLT